MAVPSARFDLPGVLVTQSSGEPTDVTDQEVQSKEQPRKRLLGSDFKRTASYVHTYGSLTFLHTDNVFNTEKDARDDTIIIAELGVWGAAPRLNSRVSLSKTSAVSPGGLKYSRFPTKYTRLYQSYAIYSVEWRRYSDHSAENSANQALGAYLQYNGIKDVSLEIWDLARDGEDPSRIGNTEDRDTYRSNFTGASATYDSGNRTYVRADASVYTLTFDRKSSEFRERTDTQYSGYVFYRVLTKTALFAEADYINSAYKDGFDNRYTRYFLGVLWERKGFSNGSFKVGVGHKNFSDSSEDDAHDLNAELLLNHSFDSKKSASANARYTNEESAVTTASYTRTLGITIEYRQKLRGKFSGAINIAYQNSSYFGNSEKQREDDIWRGSLEAQYAFSRWITGALGYERLWQNSDIDGGDFTTNNVYLKVSGEL